MTTACIVELIGDLIARHRWAQCAPSLSQKCAYAQPRQAGTCREMWKCNLLFLDY